MAKKSKAGIVVGDALIFEADITEFQPDPDNANLGTERGQFLLEESLRTTGLNRGIVVDKDNVIAIGNHTHENAVNVGFTKVVVVETEGDTLVVTRRRDFDLDGEEGQSEAARRAALLDNQAGHVNLLWDAEQIRNAQRQGLTEGIFAEWEIKRIVPVNPDDMEFFFPDDDEDGVVESEPNLFDGEELTVTTSHVVMVQLFMNTETHPPFMGKLEWMAERYQTDNTTDTVMAAVNDLAERLGYENDPSE